jgi:hypothetical protein
MPAHWRSSSSRPDRRSPGTTRSSTCSRSACASRAWTTTGGDSRTGAAGRRTPLRLRQGSSGQGRRPGRWFAAFCGRRHLFRGGRPVPGAAASRSCGSWTRRSGRPQLQRLRPVRRHDGGAAGARVRGKRRRPSTGASMPCPTSPATCRGGPAGSPPTSRGSTGSSGSRRSARRKATPGSERCAKGC